MPYIHEDRRDPLISGRDVPWTAGELNFVLTRIATEYLDRGLYTYTRMNEIIGVLEAMKLEFYRRIVGPFETRKCAENGDVYSPENLTQPEDK